MTSVGIVYLFKIYLDDAAENKMVLKDYQKIISLTSFPYSATLKKIVSNRWSKTLVRNVL